MELPDKKDLKEELYQQTIDLGEADDALAKARTEFSPVFLEWQSMSDKVLLSPSTQGLGAQPAREAEVRERMLTENKELVEKKERLYTELINAKTHYDTLTAKCNNLRGILKSMGEYN